MRTTFVTSTSITPNNASPVLKTQLTIQLQSDFAYTLAREDFTVNMTDSTNSSIVKRLNVVAVDDTAKTLAVMFGGAVSGQYNVAIRHTIDGLIDGSTIPFTVGSTVTSVSPMTGSIYGGTILTITGTNFGTVKTDNPVSIVYNGALGATSCFVLTTSAT